MSSNSNTDVTYINEYAEVIVVSPEAFERLLELSKTKHPIGKKMREAADRLDKEGFDEYSE